ncbi:MAG: VIT domain-containing protein, partial [Lautropia sp.]
MDCGIVNPTHDRPAGGIRPWLRLFAGIVGGAVGIAVALGAIVLLTATAAQAQASTAVPASSQSPQPASSRSSQSQSPEAAATLERLQGHRGSGLLLMTTAGPVVAPLQSTETRLRVTGPVVRAVVTQRFVNPGTQWLEGRYLFPLPDDAAVDHLRMKIGDRIVEGEIREKEAARRAFAQARSAGQRATLVEQQRPNAFTTEVTNIAPGAAIEIAIEFQQTLALKDGAWRLRLPGVVAPRYRSPIDPEAALIEEQTRRRDRREQAAAYDPDAAAADDADDEAFDCGDEPIEAGDDWQPPRLRQGWLVAAADATTAHDATRDGEPARGGVDRQPGTLDQPVLLPGQPAVNPLSIRVELDAGVPIGMPRSPTHAVRVDTTDAPGGSRYRIATRDGEPADRDFELEWSPAANALPQATLRVESFGGEYYGLLAINPPAIGSAAGQRQPRETTFVVDTSGSMGGESIDQARSALLFGLERLAPGDRFNVIQFNSTHSSV